MSTRHRFITAIVSLLALSLPISVRAETQTLDQALALAYQTNPGLQAARAKLRATDEQVSQALAGYRPSIDATAEGGRSYEKLPTNLYPPGTANLTTRDVGVSLNQPVFRGFRTVAGVREAEAAVLAQRASLVDTEQQLLLDAATAYLDVLQDQSVLELNRDNEHVLQQQLSATKDRFHIGELTRTDFNQAESRLNVALAARIQAENELSSRRTAFARLIGDMPGALTPPELSIQGIDNADDAAILAQKHNPAVLAATANQDAAREDVTVSEGSLLPEVNIVGNATRGVDQDATLPGQRDAASILARVTLPLYRSGTDYSRTRAAKQTVTQRRLELEDARQKASEQATTAWLLYTSAGLTIDADKAATEANENALEGVQQESKVGTRTTLDVLNAEQELLNAKISLVRAQHDRAVAILKIKAAVGQLTADALQLDVKAYDPKANYDEVRNKWVGLGSGDE